MKAPSKNISESLRGQTVPGRNAKDVAVSRPTPGVSMTVPGEGGVCEPPGTAKQMPTARQHGQANGQRYGGGGT